MILKRVFNPVAVLGYVWIELALSLGMSVAVVILHALGLTFLTLPFQVAAILGSALAIFVAFRNNSAYQRWWEARTLWSGITNACRVLARLVITFTDSHTHQANYDRQRSERFKQEMIHRIIGWAHALRLSLRREDAFDSLRRWLPTDEFESARQASNPPNTIMLAMGQRVYRAMADGTLGGFDSFQMEGQLLALANHQGSCERIKQTPLLRQYHYFTNLFLLAFIALLPLCLIGDFVRLESPWMTVPVAGLISFVFAVLGKVGQVNEDPFENRITDVPLSAICIEIERDLLDLLGHTPLPAPHAPRNGFLN